MASIALVYGVKLKKAVLAQLPHNSRDNDIWWPDVEDTTCALNHPMKPELVKRFGLAFGDFGIFRAGWGWPTAIGYPVGEWLRPPAGRPRVLPLASLGAKLAEAERLYGAKMKALAEALYPGQNNICVGLHMYILGCD